MAGDIGEMLRLVTVLGHYVKANKNFKHATVLSKQIWISLLSIILINIFNALPSSDRSVDK